ncbi:MAG: restriction endonuclease subunit R, partial [Candidatus Omnitrophica bacterium]|nr:restriction endonuclease subunit R [Candidatus Omnitrophota bacterium]
NNFRVTPGELYSKREILDWLIYSIMELAEVLKMKETRVNIKKLRTQLYYGVKEELLDLVMLKDIGRKRARRLFNAGFKNITSMRQATDKQLAEILGPSLGMSIKKEILLSAKR